MPNSNEFPNQKIPLKNGINKPFFKSVYPRKNQEFSRRAEQKIRARRACSSAARGRSKYQPPQAKIFKIYAAAAPCARKLLKFGKIFSKDTLPRAVQAARRVVK
jgi:hypothetical protein